MSHARTCLTAATCVLSLHLSGVVLAATYDLTGTWSYSTSAHWVTGICPKGQDSSGTLRISQTGDSFTLEVLSGMTCSPPAMCSFAGSIAGAVYTAKNSAVVDSEGGTASNTVTFTASSAFAASGSDSSAYNHPTAGTTCTWGFTITLSRAAPDAGPSKDGAGTAARDTSQPDGARTPDAGAQAEAATPPPGTNDNGGCQLGRGATGNPALLVLLLAVPAIACRLARRRGRDGRGARVRHAAASPARADLRRT